MTAPFSSRLSERIRAGASPVVVGLDPRPEALPVQLAPDRPPAQRIRAFADAVLPVVARYAPVVKPNIAFYERFGADGFAAYEAVCGLARELGLLVIGDVKRGDIGSTAEAYAAVHLDLADAVTVQPYLGRDALEPFFRRCREGRAVFVLVRTSNPSAREFQDRVCDGAPLCDLVARAVHAWGEEVGGPDGYTPVGAVVGATGPADLARLRRLMPRAWLLLPGVGAQGARVADCTGAFDGAGLGGLVHQSRGITQCFSPGDEDWLEAIERAAAAFARETAALARAGGESAPA